MKILVDADACPVVIKDMLYRIAERTKIELILVANQYIRTPYCVKFIQVGAGFDLADNKIVELTEPEDLIITSDIPLAAEVLEKGGQIITHRGEVYELATIKSRLKQRDFMDSIRATMQASGANIGGLPPLNQKDKQNFANSIDKIINKYLKNLSF